MNGVVAEHREQVKIAIDRRVFCTHKRSYLTECRRMQERNYRPADPAMRGGGRRVKGPFTSVRKIVALGTTSTDQSLSEPTRIDQIQTNATQ